LVGWVLHSGSVQFLLPFPFLVDGLEWKAALTENFACQSWGSLPFLAYNTCQTPCIDRTYDPGSGLRPTHPFRAWSPSVQS
jgi:hypothetical protein